MPRPFARLLVAVLLLCLGLAGCRREVVAPGDPVAAVKGLAAALRDNDLVRYSRLSMPPALHRQLEANWQARLAVAPPPTAAQRKDYAHWMGRLTAPDAEARLYRSLDPKLDKLKAEIGSQWPLMRATAGIFVKGVIRANDSLGPGEKAHAQAVGDAVLAWVQPALLTDRTRARQAITVVTRTARALDLPTLDQARALGMIAALEKGAMALKGAKELGRIYGVDVDAALNGVQAEVAASDGDSATMHVTYPLLGKTVQFDMELLRRDGRWYSADAVRSAEARLAEPLQPAAPAAASGAP